MSKADIGLIGLTVMGQNLVLNMNDHGFTWLLRSSARIFEVKQQLKKSLII
jgi:6-phosphogluconate dehydrogenase